MNRLHIYWRPCCIQWRGSRRELLTMARFAHRRCPSGRHVRLAVPSNSRIGASSSTTSSHASRFRCRAVHPGYLIYLARPEVTVSLAPQVNSTPLTFPLEGIWICKSDSLGVRLSAIVSYAPHVHFDSRCDESMKYRRPRVSATCRWTRSRSRLTLSVD